MINFVNKNMLVNFVNLKIIFVIFCIIFFLAYFGVLFLEVICAL